MFNSTDTNSAAGADISRHEVSEDGVTWRPYDPQRDSGELLHTRIVFAEPQEVANWRAPGHSPTRP